MWAAGLFTEIAIFFLRRDYSRGKITDEAFRIALDQLKDARVRIRNAQDCFDSRPIDTE